MLPGTPYGGTSALLDVRRDGAFKLLHGVVCECPECRPCQHCNGSGCVFDVVADPSETLPPKARAALRGHIKPIGRLRRSVTFAAKMTSWLCGVAASV